MVFNKEDFEELKKIKSKRVQLISVPVNVFESKEVDILEGIPIRKQRKDKYDDDLENFFDSEEDEGLTCHVEVKLKNFFVHKGKMVEDSKKLLRKHKALINDSVNNNFNFEHNLPRIRKISHRFCNTMLFLLYCNNNSIGNSHDATIEDYIDAKILKNSKLYKYKELEQATDSLQGNSRFSRNFETIDYPYKVQCVDAFTEVNVESYLEELKAGLKELHEKMLKITTDVNNYKSDDFRLFNFNNISILKLFIEFVYKYMRFYYKKDVLETIEKALCILSKLFSDQTTNSTKLKYYLIDHCEGFASKSNYNMILMSRGTFEKVLEDVVKGGKTKSLDPNNKSLSIDLDINDVLNYTEDGSTNPKKSSEILSKSIISISNDDEIFDKETQQ